MNKLFFSLIILCSLTFNAFGQEKRTFNFKNKEVDYYLLSNMTTSFTKFPNHKAKFIIVSEEDSLIEAVESNKSFDEKNVNKDQTLYYYLKLPNLKDQTQYSKFLKEFVLDTYKRDFFDRNTTSLYLKDSVFTLSCPYLDELHLYFSKIVTEENSNMHNCGKEFVVSRDVSNKKVTTSIRYESITIRESQQKREEYNMVSQLHNWDNHIFISLSLGHHSVDSKYRTSFDDETLVDITDVNSIWQLSSGYMFTNKLGGLVSFGLMSSKEQTSNSNGISISGSGNGFGVFKFGLGARYIPFAKKRWSIFTDIEAWIIEYEGRSVELVV